MRETSSSSSLGRAGLVAVVALTAGLLQGCARDPLTTNAIPDDYRTRHPITLSEAEHSLDIPVSAGDSRLTTAMADNIRGFAQNYASMSTGVINIQIPSGSANSASAARMAKQIRTTLSGAGVAPGKIMETRYAASPNGDSAPIRLSYVAITAMTGQCGQWPEDLSDNTFANKNWYNFGCASQSNLAAQVANPMDLVGPRGMSPIDAERRAVVIDTYRNGKNTATAN
ncbi:MULTISPECIES: CpaD family pilus assembly protein [Agrobacterium]|uniref:CpaD family pilus assembly lipoprotein n=1 Tax=Agrobacterium pusense TaxID=648995 RepID=A0A6H0ZMN4_9HYPH|nr:MULTISPECIES: CpaD family pilus assembly protein [Agrobacterium]ANV24203.1 pilus assembly protein [Rhizobium sp. S41]KGE84213.1 pilus assembly protein [Rhizobium sp. H41]HAU78957.1 pilus assembly protein CpaD [Agrobacterium sp.]MDH0871061.1 CpaD family pilus assembly protein [Agrobacterium pusense]MDH1269172.1 CpaD family pilus assembly protein [Agrobacterium pusense]